MLIQTGADPTLRTDTGLTAGDVARTNGQETLGKLLDRAAQDVLAKQQRQQQQSAT